MGAPRYLSGRGRVFVSTTNTFLYLLKSEWLDKYIIIHIYCVSVKIPSSKITLIKSVF